MTTATETPEQTPEQASEQTEQRLAEIITVDTGLPATERCDRCGAQAYIEVEMPDKNQLLFCAHHYHKHEDALKESAHRIVDHRAFLVQQENMYKGLITTP